MPAPLKPQGGVLAVLLADGHRARTLLRIGVEQVLGADGQRRAVVEIDASGRRELEPETASTSTRNHDAPSWNAGVNQRLGRAQWLGRVSYYGGWYDWDSGFQQIYIPSGGIEQGFFAGRPVVDVEGKGDAHGGGH